jgi:hypothetical protein
MSKSVSMQGVFGECDHSERNVLWNYVRDCTGTLHGLLCEQRGCKAIHVPSPSRLIGTWNNVQNCIFLSFRYTRSTKKFLKFVCLTLTTYRNFHSPPSPSALIKRSQRAFHDRWSFWFKTLIACFYSAWISSMFSKRRHLIFNLMLGNRKKSQSAKPDE